MNGHINKNVEYMLYAKEFLFDLFKKKKCSCIEQLM